MNGACRIDWVPVGREYCLAARRRILLLVLAMCLALPAYGAVLLQENFDGVTGSLSGPVDEQLQPDVKGWTHGVPGGWSVDNSNMDLSVGMSEWRGWSFTTMEFWNGAGLQNRTDFKSAEGVFAVADSDEYDDKDNPPAFDSTLISPEIRVSKGKNLHVTWDNSCRKLPEGLSQFLVSVNGGPDQVVKEYQGLDLPDTEESVTFAAPEAAGDWTAVLKWRHRAKNGWFWAIDNVVVSDTPPAPPAPLTPLAGDRDWPTYRCDVRRGGVARHAPRLPLEQVWVHKAMHEPQPAWPPPARQDVSHQIPDLSPTTTYDRVFHVAVVDGSVYYGSSADDSVYCLDAETGAIHWSFATEGPVRLAPTVTRGRVYVGSDDGHAYCLDASDGKLVWKRRGGPIDKRLPGNERVISQWPVRSGVVVDGDAAYFSAGLFPTGGGVYLSAVSSASGEEVWRRQIDASSQGYMLATPSRLFLPTGRTAPAVYDRKKGRTGGSFPGAGGCFALVLDDMLVHGPSENGNINIGVPVSKEKIVSTPGMRLIANGPVTYIMEKESITALERERYLDLSKRITAIESTKPEELTQEQKSELPRLKNERRSCKKWSVPNTAYYEFIMAGDVLFAGGDGCVKAYDASDGEELWSGEVEGKAHGLAVAAGSLYVSTDKGHIYRLDHKRRLRERESVAQAHAASEESPYADDAAGALYARAARKVADSCDSGKGYCLVLGVGDGRLAYEIAKRSGLMVVAVEPDPLKAAQARALLAKAGLNGTRVAVHEVAGDELPYPRYFANVIVADVTQSTGPISTLAADEVLRVLRPYGGAVLAFSGDAAGARALEEWGGGALPGWEVVAEGDVCWAEARRGPLEGAGEWTHTYGEPGNTACSGDTLVASPVELQWFGRPGPHRMVDRHFRNIPPLFKNGRLFVPGNEIVYALDAYNGAGLWEVEVPGSLRMGVFLDSTGMVVDDSDLYIVSGSECHTFDSITGSRGRVYEVAGPVDGREWGYLARVDDLVLGSNRAKGATFQNMTREAQFKTETLWFPNMKLIISHGLFALDRGSGAAKWTYEAGRVINTTITVGGGRVYFIETFSPKAMADTTGRQDMRALVEGGEQYLVALDVQTGRVEFKHKVDMADIQQPCYINFAKDVLLLSGSRIHNGEDVVSSGEAGARQLSGDEEVRYTCVAFDARTGRQMWRVEHNSGLAADGGHGEFNRHITVVGDIAYMWPYAYKVKTGEQMEGWKFDRMGHGCGGVSASANGLFWRGHNPMMYDLRPGVGPVRLTTATRPGCWINIIPAGGLIMIPEASAGCTCAYPIQTSLAFAPVGPVS